MQQMLGDPARLQQVLTNLVGNAFKFTSSGEIVVSADRLPIAPTDQNRILFTISDTGSGINEEKHDILCNSFTQASEGYTRQHQGAGLGLAICKRLVNLMDGSITIESEVGVGTTFYVSIPFAMAPQAARLSRRIAMRKPALQNDLKILLAEDERVNSIVMQRLMEKAGHTVVAVANGQLAVEALGQDEFDVILMDIQMPVMDGVEATQSIRNGEAGESKKDIPIIAVTAYAMVGDKDTFLNAGMNEYVVKPMEIDSLNQALAKVVVTPRSNE